MILDFGKMEITRLEHFRGGEKSVQAQMHVDELNRIMRGTLEPGASIGLHTHESNSEIIYILEGDGVVLYDGAYEDIHAGQCHYCPKGHAHSLMNRSQTDLVFFAVVPNQ